MTFRTFVTVTEWTRLDADIGVSFEGCFLQGCTELKVSYQTRTVVPVTSLTTPRHTNRIVLKKDE
jgi:hypothetical protein